MNSKCKVTILFGTQTGNAEDVAERIGRSVARIHCKARVLNLNDYPVSNLIHETLVIFICSTTGNGEFPDGMRSFWKFLLRKDLPNDSLKDLNFAVFGLGDSSYDKYNVVAKKLNKRLFQLGAREMITLALGDDQHELGYDAALDPWLLELKEKIFSFYPSSKPSIPDHVPLPWKYAVEFIDDTNGDVNSNSYNRRGEFPIAELKVNERETSINHFQDVRLLEFGIEPDIKYNPGDVAVLWPENPQEEVDEFLTLLNVPLDVPFQLVPTDSETPLPKMSQYPCTVRQCATSYFDFTSVPRRSFFELFHYFSEDELEEEKLREFTTPSGQEELFDYCNRPRRTILEVLTDFPHTTPKIPFNYLFEMIPPIRPRSFSIASALKVHPEEFHLLVAVVEYRTRLIKPRKGLCSNWLKTLEVGASVPFYIKKGSITFPQSDVPLIMVGPGTGCAPFRSFLEERSFNGVGTNYLFFGNRYRNKDFLFANTYYELLDRSHLILFTAFSRDQEKKIYVQHRIAQNKHLMWELIHEKNAVVYVAGNSKQMPQGVKDAFLGIFKEKGSLTDGESLKYLQKLESSKNYQVETWA